MKETKKDRSEIDLFLATLMEQPDEFKANVERDCKIIEQLMARPERFPMDIQELFPGYRRSIARIRKGETYDPRNIQAIAGHLLEQGLRSLSKEEPEYVEKLVNSEWKSHEGSDDPLINTLEAYKAVRLKNTLHKITTSELADLCLEAAKELAFRAVYFRGIDDKDADVQDSYPLGKISEIATQSTAILYRTLFRYARLRYQLAGGEFMPIIISANKTNNKKHVEEWQECLGWDTMVQYSRLRDASLHATQYVSELLKRCQWIRWYYTHPNNKGKKLKPSEFEKCVLEWPPFCLETWKMWEDLIWEKIKEESDGKPEAHPVIGQVANNFSKALDRKAEAENKVIRGNKRARGQLTKGEKTDKIRKYIRKTIAEKVQQLAPESPRYR